MAQNGFCNEKKYVGDDHTHIKASNQSQPNIFPPIFWSCFNVLVIYLRRCSSEFFWQSAEGLKLQKFESPCSNLKCYHIFMCIGFKNYISRQQPHYTMQTLLPGATFQNKSITAYLPPSPLWEDRPKFIYFEIGVIPPCFVAFWRSHRALGTGWEESHMNGRLHGPPRWGSVWPEPCCCQRPPTTYTCRYRAEWASRGSWCCWTRCSGASCRRWELRDAEDRLMWRGWGAQRAGGVRKLQKIEDNDSRVRAYYPYVNRAEVM